ncbi:hypothetical protein BH24ACT5_BH24ACT5_11770 [soil metagenome]
MNKLIAIPFIYVVGVVAFGTVSAASVFTVDGDGDGYAEGWLIDRWEDGTADIEAYDSDLDGTLDLYGFDRNNDGVHDAAASDPDENGILNSFAFDTDFDGYFDSWATDVNENGVPDAHEVGQASAGTYGGGYAIVGPPTNPDGFYNLMITMAGMTGQATFGTPDSDHDGYHDDIDYYPSDPLRA